MKETKAGTFTAKLYWWNPTTRSFVLLGNKPVTFYNYYKGTLYKDVTKKTDVYGKITFVEKFGSAGPRYYYAKFYGDMSYIASTSGVLMIPVH